jgi:hypothetical protein
LIIALRFNAGLMCQMHKSRGGRKTSTLFRRNSAVPVGTRVDVISKADIGALCRFPPPVPFRTNLLARRVPNRRRKPRTALAADPDAVAVQFPCVNAYWLSPLGVATTIPAPGNGSSWIYFVSKLRAGGAANACRTVHGRAGAALAPALHFTKDRSVIMPAIVAGRHEDVLRNL